MLKTTRPLVTLVALTVAMPEKVELARLTVTVPVVVMLYPWNITLPRTETGIGREVNWAIAVFQEADTADLRYSPATQNVELGDGVGSVAAPK